VAPVVKPTAASALFRFAAAAPIPVSIPAAKWGWDVRCRWMCFVQSDAAKSKGVVDDSEAIIGVLMRYERAFTAEAATANAETLFARVPRVCSKRFPFARYSLIKWVKTRIASRHDFNAFASQGFTPMLRGSHHRHHLVRPSRRGGSQVLEAASHAGPSSSHRQLSSPQHPRAGHPLDQLRPTSTGSDRPRRPRSRGAAREVRVADRTAVAGARPPRGRQGSSGPARDDLEPQG